ncbi:hypothetical protein Tco_1255690 [Tanacetum coccineum]
MGRDTITLEQAVSTISQEYLQLFCSDYFIPESLHPELPGPEDAIVNFPKGKIGVYCKFFEFANYRIPIMQFLFDLLGYYQIYLNPLYPDRQRQMMDLFGLIKNPNPKVKVGTRPHAAHEVPLLQAIAGRVVNMEETNPHYHFDRDSTQPKWRRHRMDLRTMMYKRKFCEGTSTDNPELQPFHNKSSLPPERAKQPTPEPDVAQAGGSHYSTRVLLRDAPPAFRGLPEPIQHQNKRLDRAAEAKNRNAHKGTRDPPPSISKLQVDSKQLTQQVATLQVQVTRSPMDDRARLAIGCNEVRRVNGVKQAFADVVTAGIAKGLSDGLRIFEVPLVDELEQTKRRSDRLCHGITALGE